MYVIVENTFFFVLIKLYDTRKDTFCSFSDETLLFFYKEFVCIITILLTPSNKVVLITFVYCIRIVEGYHINYFLLFLQRGSSNYLFLVSNICVHYHKFISPQLAFITM